MSYCTAVQVASEAKVTEFTTATMPTLAKVEELIAEADAEINAAISCKYVTPLAVAADLLVVRSISIALVVERVREILEVKTGSEEVSQDPAAKSAQGARGRLQKIVDGRLKLSAVLASTSDGVSSAGRTSTQCVFKVGVDQW